jgi:hypothetical protein
MLTSKEDKLIDKILKDVFLIEKSLNGKPNFSLLYEVSSEEFNKICIETNNYNQDIGILYIKFSNTNIIIINENFDFKLVNNGNGKDNVEKNKNFFKKIIKKFGF